MSLIREVVTVTLQELVELPAGSGSLINSISSYISKTMVIVEIETRKLMHDPTILFTRAVQPALWLLVFGQVIGRIRAFPTGELSYVTFMTPGILAQSVLFIAIFFGISVLWERDLGITHKLLVSPTPRTALVLGKALSAGVRGLTQAVVVYVIAMLTGVKMNWDPFAVMSVLLTIVMAAGFFSTFSMIIACLVKTRERFMGIGQVMTMPLFFASNAIYPIEVMPHWLQVVSRINPLSYVVDALRAMMVQGGASEFGLGLDYAMMLTWFVVLILIGGWVYPNIVR
jgi:ABC-2 type transport system permease protein